MTMPHRTGLRRHSQKTKRAQNGDLNHADWPKRRPSFKQSDIRMQRFFRRLATFNALQPQALFQYLDLQLRVLQTMPIRVQLTGYRRKQRLGKSALQLLEKFVEGSRERVRAHSHLRNNMMITILKSYSCWAQ